MKTHGINPKIKVPLLRELPAKAQFVGKGAIAWWKYERQSGRYGSVWLAEDFINEDQSASPMCIRNIGSVGQLIAKLLDVGEIPSASYFATRRRVGLIVPLGEGRSFVADFGEPPLALGVKPTTGRKYNWLSEDSLHFVHTCRVELYWVPRQ